MNVQIDWITFFLLSISTQTFLLKMFQSNKDDKVLEKKYGTIDLLITQCGLIFWHALVAMQYQSYPYIVTIYTLFSYMILVALVDDDNDIESIVKDNSTDDSDF